MNTFSGTTRKNIFTFFVGPLALFPAMIVGWVLFSLFTGAGDYQTVLIISMFSAAWGLLLFGYPCTLIIGLPAIMVLEKSNNNGLLPLLSIGLIVAILLSLVIETSIFVMALFIYGAISVSIGCWYANNWYIEKKL